MFTTTPSAHSLAARKAAVFGSLITMITGIFAIAIIVMLDLLKHDKVAARFATHISVALFTGFVFTGGIAVAFAIDGRHQAHRQREIRLSEKA